MRYERQDGLSWECVFGFDVKDNTRAHRSIRAHVADPRAYAANEERRKIVTSFNTDVSFCPTSEAVNRVSKYYLDRYREILKRRS